MSQINIPVKFQEPNLWKHQEQGRMLARHSREFALFFEVGTGKTLTTISILRDKFTQHKRVLRTLIFGPPIIIENWKREFLKFSKLKETDIVTLTGKGEKRREKMRELIDSNANKIVITNYESTLKSMDPLYDMLLAYGFEVVVYDEGHKLKDPSAKRTKKCFMLSQKAAHRYVLTGTPILNSMMDVFSIYKALDNGDTFGHNYLGFKSKYFYDKNAGMPSQKYFPEWILKPGAKEDMMKLMGTKALFAKKEECLDLPPLVKKKVYVELSKEQRKSYEEMKKDFITFMNSQAVVAELAITKALRLQQIISGFVKTEDGKIIQFEDNPRRQALSDILEELLPTEGKNGQPTKIIIWCVFKQNYEDVRSVCEKLGAAHVELTGDTPASDRQRVVDSFNHDPKVRVLIGHPASGGIGINLISSNYTVFYSRNFSLEYDIQAEARNYRGGSEVHDKVTRIDIVSAGTIDEVIVEALAGKQALGIEALRNCVGHI